VAALHHLLECFEAKPSFKLTYRKRSALSNGLTIFADSDWANSIFRRSTTCSLFLYNCLPISLLSKLHKSIALPTAKADSDGELLRINRGSCGDISSPILPAVHGVCPTQELLSSQPVYKDDSACIEWSNNMVSISSEAENVPSTSTSGSTSPMQRSVANLTRGALFSAPPRRVPPLRGRFSAPRPRPFSARALSRPAACGRVAGSSSWGDFLRPHAAERRTPRPGISRR
jgi:hypothetical protein